MHTSVAISKEADSTWCLSPSHTDLWSHSRVDVNVYRTVVASVWGRWAPSGRPAYYFRRLPPQAWRSMAAISCRHNCHVPLPVACCCKIPAAPYKVGRNFHLYPCRTRRTKHCAGTSTPVDCRCVNIQVCEKKQIRIKNQEPISK